LALITTIIPKQNFELVNERIGAILKLELEEQKTLQAFAEPVNVFSERLDPFDKSEEVMVNVFFDSANSFDNTQKTSQGNVSFFIDIYSTGKTSTGLDGGLDSANRLHKFLGMASYILRDSQYRTLGFVSGSIGGVYVESIQVANIEQQDAAYDTMGRISFSVKLKETGILETGELMAQHLTGVKLDTTNLGYKYEKII